MKRVLVLVEGPTEDRFVKDLLRPHLQTYGIIPISTILTTKRVKAGTDFKGGVRSFEQVESDLRRLLRDTDAALITTMLDYYGFPKQFSGCRDVRAASPRARVSELEAAIINDGRQTAPSKRLVQFLPHYRKRLHGPLVFERIGLDKIRSHCPHFDRWLHLLEGTT
jgi:hypothetical protein